SSTRIATIAPLRAKAKCHAVGRTWSAPRGDPKPGLSPVRARPRGQQALPREGSSPDGRDAASAARGAAPPGGEERLAPQGGDAAKRISLARYAEKDIF